MQRQRKYHCGYLREIGPSRCGNKPAPHLQSPANDNGKSGGHAAAAIPSALVFLVMVIIEVATIMTLMSAIEYHG